ncbi:MAG: hypothetical protein M3461_04065 [Pseudomonadota bacterium]|nr:hypothetical protein [Pseudomonadota bacterium]
MPKEVWRPQAGAAPYDDLPPLEFYDEAAQEDTRRHLAGARVPTEGECGAEAVQCAIAGAEAARGDMSPDEATAQRRGPIL